MKTDLTLTQMAQELERQQQAKRDFVAPDQSLQVVATDDANSELHLELPEVGQFPIRPYAHGQIAQHLGIPKTYYDKMREQAPHLLATNANHWLATSPAKRMVRTLDGEMRAYVSHRYRPLDHFDLAEAVLPVLLDDGQVRVESASITETRMYIKVVTERLTAEVQKGDVVQAGLVVSNSEVGAGSVKVEPLLLRLVCLNGAIANDYAMRKHHVGRSQGENEGIHEFLRDETRRLDDQAFWAKVQDVVRGTFTEVIFLQMVTHWQEATQQPITGDPAKVVEVTAKHLGVTEAERSGILRHLIEGGDLSRYGLANAVTRQSQDSDDYDRATELERMGSQIVEIPQRDWQRLATAA